MNADEPPQFPGYAVVEQLHAGPRSNVFRARRAADGQSVVLKVAHGGAVAVDEALARLRREMALLGSVRSDRVAHALDVVRIGDDAALVLDDSGGESLNRYLARARFSLGDALGIALGAAAALRDVHAAGIIHKDVTPNNIVYNAATGQAQLIDFDVASPWRTEHHGFVSPGALEGTLLYMAPEQTGRMNRSIDSRADLYAFGVTLFELLTGRLPFREDDILAIVHAHLAVRPPRPDAIEPAIPRPLAAIVTKLLAKSPEDRYQTAAGLLEDLRTCLVRYVATGTIAGFALGSSDVARRFELPTRLYGRSSEFAALTGALDRATAGGVEIALLSGPSGVGKTSVVHELFPQITRDRGYFLSGKFEQLRGEAPYAALVAAFDGLIHQLLTESEAALDRWRQQIAAAIAPNAQIVIDAIPALERILGPQPPVVEVDAAATRSRFQLTLQKFIQVFTRRAHPLVLFVDDMQWADPESIELLKLVAMSQATEALLLIEAYRDNEVSEDHPVRAAVRELRSQRTATEIVLAPLAIDDLAALIADTLHRTPAEVAPLAHLVSRKTDGNPFFVRQLLLALHEAGHIAPMSEHGREHDGFAFDAQAIERAPISENVADLLAANLRKLPDSTQRALAMAAAIGSRFELDMLALVADCSPAAVHAELAAAIGEELVVPLTELEYLITPRGAGLVFRRLRFQHDRVQRAAYALMSPGEQQHMHLRIGELLLASAGPELASEQRSDHLFDIVAHLDRAIALIDDPARIAELGRLNVLAARKARGSAAYRAATEFLRVAVACFDWRAAYREQLEAHAMLAECMYFTGDVQPGLEILDVAAAHAAHDRDRAMLEGLRAMLFIHANDMRSAIACTRRASALLGLPLPEGAALGPAIGAAIHDIAEQIASREVEQLIDLPVMTDPDARTLAELFHHCIPAAFQHEPPLGAFITAQIVLLSLAHGNCPASAMGYGVLASLLRGSPLNHLASRFGGLGLALNRRLDDRAHRPAVEFVYAMFSSPWLAPMTDAISHLRDGARCAREIGDHIFAGNTSAHEIGFRTLRGAEPLKDIRTDAEAYRQHCLEVSDTACARLLTWQIDRIRALTGEIDSLADAENDPRFTVGASREDANPVHLLAFATLALDAAFASGEIGKALELASTNQPLEASVPGMMLVVEHQLYHSLAAAAIARTDPTRRDELAAVIARNQQILARWVAECPANFEAMHLLVAAESAPRTADLGAILPLYDRATASAARHGLRRIEALGHELHGQLWLERDQPDIALVSLGRARGLYAAMGAQRKLRILDRKHPGLVRAAQPWTGGTVTTTSAAQVLDVTAIARATRAISGELERDKLLTCMLDIIFVNAGAEGGALVLDDERGLTVAASRDAGTDCATIVGSPLELAALPRSILYYVHRTGAEVVLDNASASPRFGNDEYIRTRAPRSVLCMPIKHTDRAIGVLYLENTLVSGAFTSARLEALSILVSQLSVSLENASLFAAQRVHGEAISRANAELRGQIAVREQAERALAEYRDQLEGLIAERTKELTLANQKLRDAAREHERIEAELRLAQKLESVGRLAAGVAHEINTPVQFVSDNVTFVRDALPAMTESLARYRELATVVETGGDARAAAATARATEQAGDVDYVLDNTPPALGAALEGLHRVAAIVRSLKDFAHPDRDEKTPVDLNRAIETTLVIAGNECKYVADVTTELSPLPQVRCNGGEINQAVLNLVINAAHAIRDVVGQTGRRGKITVCTRLDGDDVEIAISDTGAGIPAAIRDKIYDPFFTTKEVGLGTGQGLAIVHSVVVDKHGGSLRFETEPGIGTTFFVRLPVGVDAVVDPAA